MSNLVLYNDAAVNKLGSFIDGIFDEFARRPSFAFTRNWRPTNVDVSDKEYTIEVELPRVKRDEVKVEAVDGNTVIVSVNTKTLVFERSFSYSDAEADKTEVKLEDGVLTLKVPRVAPKTKLLEIK